ncbi:MAG: NAD(P)-dependent alcohol dehydrogenase [Microbacteriaceae bacterium]
MSFDRYGGPEVVHLVALPDATPADTEVLVRVRAVCVTAADSAARAGKPAAIRAVVGLLRPRQRILGTEFAGEIVAVGAGVTRFVVGERVVAASGASFGAHAELVAVSQHGAIAVVPEGLDLCEALAICEGGLTALPFLRDEARLRAGQTIAINGASGSVGSAGVQIARLLGADVTAVSSAANAALTTVLGAVQTIDYHREDFTRLPHRFDVIFDAVGTRSFDSCRRALAPGGTYLTTVPSLGILCAAGIARFTGHRARLALTGLRSPALKRADMEWLIARAVEGSLVGVIDACYDLADAAAAHRRVDSRRKRGAVLLTTGAAVR